MLLSLVQKLPNPALRDTGLEEQTEILETVLSQGRVPVVLEAKAVLTNPEAVLREACNRLDLPFERGMLRWPAGPKPEGRRVGKALVRQRPPINVVCALRTQG